MSKNAAEIRFENARKRLSTALKELENVMKEKLHESAIEARMIDRDEDGGSSHHAKLIEQSTIIENLNSEINNLQKNLLEVGKQSDFLNEKNKVLGEKLGKFRERGASLVEAIEADIARIAEVIKNEE